VALIIGKILLGKVKYIVKNGIAKAFGGSTSTGAEIV